jgi:hypothetical protein
LACVRSLPDALGHATPSKSLPGAWWGILNKNNPPIVGVDIRGCIGEAARLGQNVWVGAVLIKKVKKILEK